MKAASLPDPTTWLAGQTALRGCHRRDDDDTAEKPAAAPAAPAAQAEQGTYVGKVEGSDAYIAVVSDGKRLSGYICDGKQISTWIAEAPIVDASAKLASRKGIALGEATFAGEEASGKVIIDGKGHTFAAELGSGDAGLYYGLKGKVGKPKSAESGLIVLADGSQRGATAIIRKVMAEPMINIAQPNVNISGLGNLQLRQVNSIQTISGG